MNIITTLESISGKPCLVLYDNATGKYIEIPLSDVLSVMNGMRSAVTSHDVQQFMASDPAGHDEKNIAFRAGVMDSLCESVRAEQKELLGIPYAFYKTIRSLNFSARLEKVLLRNGIHLVLMLVRSSSYELLSMPDFGKKSLKEVQDVLASMGLGLSMDYQDIQDCWHDNKHLANAVQDTSPSPSAGKSFSFGDLQRAAKQGDMLRDDTPAIFHKDISVLDLSSTTIKLLRDLGVNTIYDVVGLDAGKLLKLPQFVAARVSDIDDALAYLGFWLGMTNDEIMSHKE